MRSTVRVTHCEVVRRPCGPAQVVVTVNRIGGSISAPSGNDGGSGIAGGASEVRDGEYGRPEGHDLLGRLASDGHGRAGEHAGREDSCDWSDELHGSLVVRVEEGPDHAGTARSGSRST